MDSLQILVVDSPFANMTSLYQVDPEADILLIVPPFNPSSFAPLPGTASTTTAPGLRLKVSSKHLTLSSKPFKNKLQSARSSQLQSDGRIHVSLSPSGNFDPRAVKISLDAIHGRGSKVPKVVDLETLAKISYFADKFQLHDNLDIYADRWIRGLWKDVQISEETSQRDLVLWIYIAYVFKQAEIFKIVTRQAALGASGPIDTLGLPIREKIISKFPFLFSVPACFLLTAMARTHRRPPPRSCRRLPAHHPQRSAIPRHRVRKVRQEPLRQLPPRRLDQDPPSQRSHRHLERARKTLPRCKFHRHRQSCGRNFYPA